MKGRKSLSKIQSHIKYLENCKSRKIIPRFINLAILTKSGELWKGNKKTIFNILTKSSEELLNETLARWKNEKNNLENNVKRTEDKLIEYLGEEEAIDILDEAIKMSELAFKKEMERKQTKLVRDEEEKVELVNRFGKKKKNRRFRRRNPRLEHTNNNTEETEEINNNEEEINANNLGSKVKNISSKDLTEDQRKLLELGPKFCLVEHDIDRARFQKDLNEGFRRMKLEDHFYPDEDSRSEEEKRFYLKQSVWEPNVQNVNKSLTVHNNIIQHKFDQWKQPIRVASNVSNGLQTALKSLKDDDTIDIKLDDKSGSFVVADKTDCKAAALNDLAKQTNIIEIGQIDKEKLIKDIEDEVEKVVNSMLARNELKETTAKYIKHKAKEHKLARFYIKWKCHKYLPTMTEFASAAVRGIVSCSGTADEAACDFLDFVLNPGMRELRSYLKGTTDFLSWVERIKQQYPELPPLFSILTMDFTCMYPSIPDDLMLPAVTSYLESRTENFPSTEKTLELLEVTKKFNFFEFGNQCFKQVGGTSIGKKHAPPLA